MATRTRQRERTRMAIVDAVADLVQSGNTTPTIDDVAEAATVSRATIYRYFESIDDLLWQMYADRHIVDPDSSMAIAGDDLGRRVRIAEQNINDFIFGDEEGTRAFERVTLERRAQGRGRDDDRPGRRFDQIDVALAPLAGRLDDGQLELVRHALSLAIGSHSMLALLDTGRLDPERAREVTRFTCDAIVAEAERMVAENAATEGDG